MYYRGFYINKIDYGYAIINKQGSYIYSVETDDEAYSYIDEILDDEKSCIIDNEVYKSFEKYCNKLPGKCYIEDKLASSFPDVLKRFINSFEKNTKTKVITKEIYRSGETFMVVDEITVL